MAAQETLAPFPLTFGPLSFSSLSRGGVQSPRPCSICQPAIPWSARCGKVTSTSDSPASRDWRGESDTFPKPRLHWFYVESMIPPRPFSGPSPQTARESSNGP